MRVRISSATPGSLFSSLLRQQPAADSKEEAEEDGVSGLLTVEKSELAHGRGAGLSETGQLSPEEGRAPGSGPGPRRRQQQHPGPDPARRQAEESADPAGAAAQRQGFPPLCRRSDPQHPRGSEEDQRGFAGV